MFIVGVLREIEVLDLNFRNEYHQGRDLTMKRFLFDRLCEPCVKPPKDSQDKLEYWRCSITKELQRLVCNRSFFEGLHIYDAQKGATDDTVLNFGINDIISRHANFADTDLTKEQIRLVINQYEPRLLDVDISLKATDDPCMPAAVLINGKIKMEQLSDEFSWSPLSELS